LNDEVHVALISDVDDTAFDEDVAWVLRRVGVFYRVGAGLVDRDDDVVDVRLGPPECFQPLPQAAADDERRRGFGVDGEVQLRWCVRRIGACAPVSARRRGECSPAATRSAARMSARRCSPIPTATSGSFRK
jgi:hypothetical protein